jgi:hypothetical protein
MFTEAGGTAAAHIAKWNGSSWSGIGTGITTGDYINALAFDSNGNLYAGGSFTQAGGIDCNNIAKWGKK